MDESGARDGCASRREGGTLVAVEGVGKRYGERVAVDGLGLRVHAGEVFGLAGANGGGKTTTLRILAGILRPDAGHGQVLGFDLLRDAREVRARVGYMSQKLSLYGDLTVFENLRFRAEVYALARPRAAARAAIEEFELSEYRDTPSARLSGGWARRLQLAAALIHSPRLILLDEPTVGLDAASRQQVWQRVERLAEQGAAVIVSTHELNEASRCSAALFMSEGRVVTSGTPMEISESAPARAFLVSGVGARALSRSIETVAGVLAGYPHGTSLRVIARPEAEENLRRVVQAAGAALERVPTSLEDAALAFSEPNARRTTCGSA